MCNYFSQYDHGDPLVQENTLIGYYIGGDFCNMVGKPECYANVPTLRPWILEKIKQNSKEHEREGIDDNKAFEEE